MFAAAGVDHRDYMRGPRRQNAVRKLRGQMRDWLTRQGIRTRKERRQWQEWQRKSDGMFLGFQADAQANRYADMRFTLTDKPRPDLSFDGSYLRRALDISWTPVE